MTAKVEIRNVTKRFGSFAALSDVSLSVEAGEFAVLLGPSGCGKSTLLSIVGGFETPSEGQVLIGGKDVTHAPPIRRPTTTMFQDYALFPHMTVAGNVAFGPRMQGLGRAARHARALEFLELVGLRDAAGKRPHELSGGQRQRVALARALAVEPDVLLLDEPLGALDLKLRRQMQDELKAIQRRVGTTFIHVTHDQEEAMAIADRIVVLNQGRVEDCGTPAEIYMRPKSLFAAGFMGEINFLPGTVAAVDARGGDVDTVLGGVRLPLSSFRDGPPPAQARVILCIRPEHFREGASADALDLGEARIVDSAFFGTHHRCHLAPCAAPAMVLVAHLPQSAEVAEGETVLLRIDPGCVVALPAAA